VLASLAKIARAGLGGPAGSPYFTRITGMNMLGARGKCDDYTWRCLIANTGVDPRHMVIVGDEPICDWEMPRRCGIGFSFIVRRDQAEEVVEADGAAFVRSLDLVPGLVRHP